MKYTSDVNELLKYTANESQKDEIIQLSKKGMLLDATLSVIMLIALLSNLLIHNPIFNYSILVFFSIFIINSQLISMNRDIRLTEYSKLNLNNIIFVTSKSSYIGRFINFLIGIIIFVAIQIIMFH